MGFDTYIYGNPKADTLLVQMVDDHDMGFLDKETAYIRDLTAGRDFCLIAVKVNDWNKDLAPWKAPAVFGKEDFGDGAADTLRYLKNHVLDQGFQDEGKKAEQHAEGEDIPGEGQTAEYGKNLEPGQPQKRVYIGGYSLAGLFALWAGCQTDCFSGAAAASPSIWYPHFLEYMRENPVQTDAVYLSLGDREERTRNPVMAEVGHAIRDAFSLLQDGGTDSILEWNKGNHFKDPDLRTAKAFAWLMNRQGEPSDQDITSLKKGEVISISLEQTRQMLCAVCDAVIHEKPRLTRLDGPIGDGDHGIGMSRGMTNAKAFLDKAEKPESIADLFYGMGRAMISSMGGSSGVIFGTMFMGASTGADRRDRLDGKTFTHMMRSSLDQVKKKGKAMPGDKTMVDALEPAVAALEEADTEDLGQLLSLAAREAEQGAEASRDMIARHGHSKTLGERALGHPDPGAVSTAIIFRAMADYIKEISL